MEPLATNAVFLCILALLAYSLNMVFGWGGIVSLANAAFLGIGAYAAAIATVDHGIPVMGAYGLAILLAAVAGLAVGGISLRLGNDALLVATLGFHLLFVEYVNNASGVTRGPRGMTAIPVLEIAGWRLDRASSYLVLAAAHLAVVVAVLVGVSRTRWVRDLRAVREDEMAAAALGKDRVRVKLQAFVLSAAIAGSAGATYAFFLRFVHPEAFAFTLTLQSFVAVLLGGAGNLAGVFLGSIAVVAVPEVVRELGFQPRVAGPVIQVVFAAVLLLVVFARPRGLIPEFWVLPHLERRRSRALAAASRRRPAAAGSASGRPARVQSPGEPVLRVRGATFAIGSRRILDDCSLELSRGEVVGLVGPNGAGKTTLFNVISGFVPRSSADIVVAGTDVSGLPAYQRARSGLYRTFQESRLFPNLPIADNLATTDSMSHSRGSIPERIPEVLRAIGLDDRSRESAANLSFGQQKLLSLAQARLTDARVFLLDEVSSGVAPLVAAELSRTVRMLTERGAAVLLIEHNTDFLSQTADRILFMHAGRIVRRGQLAELMADRALSEVYFGSRHDHAPG